MKPPPTKNQAKPQSEFMRTPRGPRYNHVYQNLTYDETEGEDESPLIHPKRPHRETTRPEERRKPSVKYEFPKFDGKEFREWLFMAERYFLCHHVPQEEWIEIATANMTGLARTHYLWFAHKTVNPTWEKYRASLQMRFGDSAFIDYDQDLKNLVQTTTVAPYQWEFEQLVSMVNWPEKALIGAFKGGLRKDIKRMIKVHHFETLEECFSMARVYEENIDEEKEERREKKERKAHRTDKQKKKPSYSSASRNKERAMVPYQGGKTIRPNQRQGRERPTRYLTPQQMEEYKKKGLCYWCDGKWDKNHRCIEKLYNIVVVDDSECSSSSESVASSFSSSSEEEVQVKKKGKKKEKDEEKAPTEVEQPEEVASLHSIQDPYQPNALRVFGRVNGQRVMILLDNGATKNFLIEEAAERCKITPTGISPQIIIVGGGLRTKCQHEVKGIDVTVKKQTFKVDCLVIPLEGVDLILGMPWFLTSKDIHWDVKNFAMTFFPEEGEETIRIQALGSSTSAKAALKSIQQEQPACWVMALATDDRAVVPPNSELKRELLQHFHDSPAAGHEGVAKTISQVKAHPKKKIEAPTTVAAGGVGGAAGSELVLDPGESQGKLGPDDRRVELESVEPSPPEP
ncbi:hypothetical protein EJ110_NYTH28949 [Nymphaea thermarum]|nr:hypothetical protein EJ110_NYTH28949 [Nymphaea thermarum]